MNIKPKRPALVAAVAEPFRGACQHEVYSTPCMFCMASRCIKWTCLVSYWSGLCWGVCVCVRAGLRRVCPGRRVRCPVLQMSVAAASPVDPPRPPNSECPTTASPLNILHVAFTLCLRSPSVWPHCLLLLLLDKYPPPLTSFPLCAASDEQIPGALLGRKDFWRKMFKSQSAASDTSSQSEQDTSECTTAHSGTTTDRRSRSRSRRISLRKKLKLPIGESDLHTDVPELFYHNKANGKVFWITAAFHISMTISQSDICAVCATSLRPERLDHFISVPLCASACRRTARLPITRSVLRMWTWIHPNIHSSFWSCLLVLVVCIPCVHAPPYWV